MPFTMLCFTKRAPSTRQVSDVYTFELLCQSAVNGVSSSTCTGHHAEAACSAVAAEEASSLHPADVDHDHITLSFFLIINASLAPWRLAPFA